MSAFFFSEEGEAWLSAESSFGEEEVLERRKCEVIFESVGRQISHEGTDRSTGIIYVCSWFFCVVCFEVGTF